MYTIQTNASGTRSMEISEENLQTIEKYALFQHLIDSNGIVDESVLDKLKLNIRSLITSEEGNNKEQKIVTVWRNIQYRGSTQQKRVVH